MKKKVLAMLLVAALAVFTLTACGGDSDSSGSNANNSSNVSTGNASGVSFVDGFYANNGQGSDFMIAFYEGSAGDVAYVNDGTNEALAQYTVEKAQTPNGTDYLLVTVGNLQIGYVDNGGDDIYLVDMSSGDIYAAGRLTESQADEIYNALQ
ncbi:MAG: hypothetical protein K6G81_06490 [Lachnospiraceae bacterium]|nr:hypothetical protein [Lachnospiraceae bacterium]